MESVVQRQEELQDTHSWAGQCWQDNDLVLSVSTGSCSNLGKVIQTQPTIGSNVEEVTNRNVTFQVWDMGGSSTVMQVSRGSEMPGQRSSRTQTYRPIRNVGSHIRH